MNTKTKQKQRRRAQSGFTLVEMLLVLVILATLAAIVVPKFAGRSEQAKVTAALTQIKNLEMALAAFEVDNGFYPKGSGGLEDLVEPPNNANDWRGPYIDDVPIDPWGNEYAYTYPGKHNTRGFDILSMGPDGRSGGDDDINNWTKKK
ncbi:MAG: type II secretion system major pseudopilin GspG [Candidatus Hinthialibacter antarcticus]|nr:type II secretion system major pseudopilin GspG [Candidatus Hinthialibacter antarcticus]